MSQLQSIPTTTACLFNAAEIKGVVLQSIGKYENVILGRSFEVAAKNFFLNFNVRLMEHVNNINNYLISVV